jgi:hypothetical protein
MDKKTALAVIVWCIRLTLIGMPLGYVRFLLLKKHEEVELGGDPTEDKFK